MRQLRILSLGGGTQSCALALMSAAGDLPKLDHIIFADTQGELPETYAYLDYMRPIVEAAGIGFHIVTAGSLEQGLLGAVPNIKVNPTPPAHLLIRADGEDTKGRLSTYKCSFDYKRRQVTRKVKELCGERGEWKRITVEQWIGFSEDEIGRTKQATECRCGHNLVAVKRKQVVHIHAEGGGGCSRCACDKYDPWQVNRWPLIEMGMRREDTIRWFAANGHPTPPRSACWFCPNSGNERWQALRLEHPDLFERACVIDDSIRHIKDFKRLDTGRRLDAEAVFLHASLTPLREADLRTARQVIADSGQGALFDDDVLAMDCQAGVCFT